MRKVGALAYSTTAQESGWMLMPLPAIYDGEAMKPYREWLNNYSSKRSDRSVAASSPNRIKDYYVDPIEVGYGGLIDFKRDFIGRDALLQKSKSPRRKKVTLVWNNDDVADVMRAGLFSGSATPAKYVGLPNPMYATFQYDSIMKGSHNVGVSQWVAYTANAGSLISLSLIDARSASPEPK